MIKTNNCKNCETEFEGNYCFNCGQPASANERLRFTNIIKDFFDNTFNLHKGFFFTFWKLIVNPREVAISYIQGSRKKYTNPTRYLVIALALLGFVQFWVNFNEIISSEDILQVSFLPEQLNKSRILWALRLVKEWTLLGNLLEALVFPIGFYWLFRQLKYNYSELLTLSFYLISNSIFVLFICMGISKLLINDRPSVLFVIGAIYVYYIYALMTFFREVSLLKRIVYIFIGLVIFLLISVFINPLLLAILFPITIN